MTDQVRKTGGSNEYYSADVVNTLDGRPAYTVQCLEVIETLGMTFAEGEAFKAIWRSCAARTLGKQKADNNALYDAEKVEFYGKRMVVAASVRPCDAPPDPVPTDPDRPSEATHWNATYRRWVWRKDGRYAEWVHGGWFGVKPEAVTETWLKNLHLL